MIKWSELLRGAFVGRLCVAGAVAAAAAAVAPSLPPRSTQVASYVPFTTHMRKYHWFVFFPSLPLLASH